MRGAEVVAAVHVVALADEAGADVPCHAVEPDAVMTRRPGRSGSGLFGEYVVKWSAEEVADEPLAQVNRHVLS